MRLMFVTGSLHRGGAERHAVSLMNGLAERGHECAAVYIKCVGGTVADLGLDGAVAVHPLGASRYLDLRAMSDLAALIAQCAPDVLVATNPYALMYATLARSGRRIPLLTTFHSTRPHGFKERLQMLVYRPLFWRADCTVFVSAAQRSFWRRRGLASRRSEVIHNGIDAEGYFAPRSDAGTGRRRELGFGDGDYVIGICAWLRPEKNHVQLVEAIARLRAAGLPARALLIGDGELREAITERARELGIGDHVTITGERRDVRPDLAACDVVVLCSVAVETFSLAALEAMALEKPVVHAELGGARELILDGYNGYLFPVRDTDALVQRLRILADRECAQRLGRNARLVVREAFTARGMIDRYERLLGETSRQARAGRKPGVLLLGPDLGAVSGVSTHVNMLLGSTLADRFDLRHFQVGSEGRSGRGFNRVLRTFLSPLRLAATILRGRPAIVHINTSIDVRAFWRDLAHLLAARIAGSRVIYQVHGGELPVDFAGGSRFVKAVIERALRLPDCIVVLAKSELAAYKALLPGQRVRVIPNAVETFPPRGDDRPRDDGAPVEIVYLGRLVPAKGLHDSLRGLRDARAGGADARLTIAGSGPDETALRRLVAELDLESSVRFTGPVFGAEKERLLARSDVLALPTYHAEGLPYALLEAMSAGLAVITTRVAAIPDVVTEGVHGLFVPPRDPAAIAAAITQLAADRQMLRRMGNAGRERVAEAYSLPRLAAEFGELYARLADNLPARGERGRSTRHTPA